MKKWLWLRLTTTEFHPVKSAPQWSSVEALLTLTTVVVSKIHPSEVGDLLPSQPFLIPPQIFRYKKRSKMENWSWLRLTATEFHQVKSTPKVECSEIKNLSIGSRRPPPLPANPHHSSNPHFVEKMHRNKL